MPPAVYRRGRLFALAALLAVVTPLAAVDPKPSAEAVVERMRKDLFYLAGPECAGRASGGPEIDKAADFIAASFKAAGLKPAMKDGSYFQPFAVVLGGNAPVAPTGLKLASKDGQSLALKLAGQFSVTGDSAAGKLAGDLVFAGYGITSESPAYDDYKGLDVKGKVVVILRRTPKYKEGGKNPFGADGGNYARVDAKLKNAVDRGAAGVILVSDRTIAESDDPLIAYQAAGIGQAAGAGPVKVPVLHVKRYVLDHLLQAVKGKTLADVEAEIDRTLAPKSADLTGWTAAGEVVVKRREAACKNVVGYLDGSGPLANETIVVGAHYDHMGDGTLFPGSLGGAAARGQVHYGADDNGSGTTGLLELARRFGEMKERQGRRIVFIAFSAEERGLHGSKHYCREPLFPLERTAWMLNLDMIGRSIPVDAGEGKMKDRLLVYGTGTADGMEKLVNETNKSFDFKLTISAPGTGPSDHQSFNNAKVPVLFFYTGSHVDYHRPGDTPDKINYAAMKKVVDMSEVLMKHFATVSEKPVFVPTKGGWVDPTDLRRRGGPAAPTPPATPSPTRPAGAALNFQMDYTDPGPGILIEVISPEGVAEKAGLKAGDRILEVAGKAVKDAMSYMELMAGVKPGVETEFTVRRKGKNDSEKIKIVPAVSTRR